ncbi:MAG TPA: hypothetical protein VF043_08460 [Ktedonobacteraceae bacterium]
MDEKTELRKRRDREETQEVEEYRIPLPHWPWPTSIPGPFAVPPPPGQAPMPTRTDQMVEIEYNQEKGEPSIYDPRRSYPDDTTTGPAGFDQQETVQDVVRKQEQR